MHARGSPSAEDQQKEKWPTSSGLLSGATYPTGMLVLKYQCSEGYPRRISVQKVAIYLLEKQEEDGVGGEGGEEEQDQLLRGKVGKAPREWWTNPPSHPAQAQE